MKPFRSVERDESSRSRPHDALHGADRWSELRSDDANAFEALPPAAEPTDTPVRMSQLARDLGQLAKLRVNVLVGVTAAIGFLLALAPGTLSFWLFVNAVSGTFLLGCAASVLNQVFERRYDALMRRTERRPVAAGRLSPGFGLGFAAFALVAGTLQLAMFVNLLTTILGLLTVLTYIAFYTPLKRMSPISLPVGAIAGALPPVMGWTAAAGTIGWEAVVLFAILFLWQIPHFHAIAWLYRRDYADGGFRLLAVVKPDGRALSIEVVATAFLLTIVSVIPIFLDGVAAWLPFAVLPLAVAMFGVSVVFATARSEANARRLLFTSLAYLPAILVSWVCAAI
ncbi:MAG: heme o synthase [Planctomycetota bacterium]